MAENETIFPPLQSFEALKKTKMADLFTNASNMITFGDCALRHDYYSDKTVLNQMFRCTAALHVGDAGTFDSQVFLDKTYDIIHILHNRTLHASTFVCAPGGSFFAQNVVKVGLQ